VRRLVLTRTGGTEQTLGVLSVREDGEPIWSCATLELPWRHNERRESCIPPGPPGGPDGGRGPKVYDVTRHVSQQYGQCFWVRSVPGRSEILIHAGNFLSDTLGCILVGREHRDFDGDDITDVTRSQDTLAELRAKAPRNFELAVRWADASDMDVAGVQELETPDAMELAREHKTAV